MADDLVNRTLTVILDRQDNVEILLRALTPLIRRENIFPLLKGIQDIAKDRFRETIKIAINIQYGGFSLSKLAKKLLKRLCPQWDRDIRCYKIRDDPNLHFVIEKLGKQANGFCAKLAVVDFTIYPGKIYDIDEYDGLENLQLIDGEYHIEYTLAPDAEEIYRKFLIDYPIN